MSGKVVNLQDYKYEHKLSYPTPVCRFWCEIDYKGVCDKNCMVYKDEIRFQRRKRRILFKRKIIARITSPLMKLKASFSRRFKHEKQNRYEFYKHESRNQYY